MQWLVDLVIAVIGIPPTFIDRGDFAGNDFTTAFFTRDANWYDIDLSAIVPAGAVAVLLAVRARAGVADAFAMFRENGNVNTENASRFYTQAGNIYFDSCIICALSSSRVIEYRFDNVAWNSIILNVRGWWL